MRRINRWYDSGYDLWGKPRLLCSRLAFSYARGEYQSTALATGVRTAALPRIVLRAEHKGGMATGCGWGGKAMSVK
jgi:hypothetical protein